MTALWVLAALIVGAMVPAFAEERIGGPDWYVQSALDNQGNIHIAYVSPAMDVFYRRYDGSTWSDSSYLGNSTPCWLTYTYPAIAVGSDLVPHIVYGTDTGSYPHDLNYFTYARASNQACTSWVYTTIGNDGLRRGTADIALDASNQPHMVYKQTNKYSPWWHKIIYRDPCGIEHVIREKWDPQQVVRPRIAYSNGTVHITWWETGNNRTNIWYAASPNFTPQQLSNVGYRQYVDSPGIGVAPDGHVEIAYLVADWNGSPYYVGLFSTRPGWTNGVQLTGAAALSEEFEDFWPPNVAFHSNGDRYISWYHWAEHEHYYMGPGGTNVFYSPGHIDVCAGAGGAYYLRCAGDPGPMYFQQIAGGGSNVPPTIQMLSPPAQNAEANASYTLSWSDDDPDNNATIALFYDTNSSGFDGTPIPGAQNIPEDPDGAGDQFIWNITGLPDNSRYWVYATIDDGTSPVTVSYSPGYVFVNHVNDPPSITLTSPSSPDTVGGGTFEIAWTDDDPDDDASIWLFYSSVDAPNESTLIVFDLSEDDAEDSYAWNISSMPPGTYRIYARIFDGQYNGYSHSTGTVTVLTSITFAPTDDASVYRDWEPDLPHGDRDDLDVGADDQGTPDELAFFRFEVAGLEYGVVRAYLRLRCVESGGGGGAHSVNSTTWTEETLTWNNKPGMGASPVSSIPWVYEGNWYAYEVTSLVVGNGTYAFALRSTEPNGAHFASKEYETTSLRPYLEVLMGGEIPELPPTARIDSILPNPVIQGFHPAVGFYGSGWDNDEGGASIVAWTWTSSLNGQIGTASSFTLAPTALATGVHTVSLTVQDNEGEWSVPDTSSLEVLPPDTSPPTWPDGTGIQAVEDLANGGSVRLLWNAATDQNPPIRYNVYYSTSSPAFSGTCQSDVSWTPGLDYSCTFVVPGLTVDVPYYFGVRAVDLVGNEDTNTVELICTPSESGPPSFVNDPSVSGITSGSAFIWWSTDEPTTGIVGYWVGPDDSTAVEDPTMATDHSVHLTGLQAATAYFFRVYAVDSSQNWIQSDVDTFTTAQLPTYEYLPVDDAYVSSAEPDANFGGSTLLLVSAGQISYLKFVVPDEGDVVGAELRVVAATSGDSATVWPVASITWAEETITWNTRPFLGGTAIGGIPAQTSAYAYTVDLSAYITAPGTYSLAINGPPSRGGAFYSKEHTNDAQQPCLRVTCQEDGQPPSQVGGLQCLALESDVFLTWQPSTDNVGVAGYRVYRGSFPYFQVLPRTLIASPQTTQFTDLSVLGDPSVDHFYAVTAFDDAGNESIPSARVGEKEYELLD
ncbi:fibronectin type III domain-containing protein [Candidatus Fermentibacteria bacterium]|nr:fibronectin type III domain-containing protein [Candidatus Fermentibacteria bacterium]